MLVAINMLGIRPGWGAGEEMYLRRVLDRMRALQKNTDFLIVCDPESAESYKEYETLTVEDTDALVEAVSQRKADALLSSLRTAPRRSSVPLIVLIMELYGLKEDKASRRILRTSPLKESKEIIGGAVAAVVPSEFLKRELLEILEVPLNKTIVAQAGIAEEFGHQQRCIVEQPYFLIVGRFIPRKNFALLLEAFERVSSDIPHNLVVVGQPTDSEPEDWGPQVVRIDRVGTAQLAGLYQHCDLFICPSLYEGSGVLVLEALKSGARVATGRVGGITEIAGDAPIFFNPESVDSLVGAIRRAVSESDEDRERRIKAGSQVTADCSWDKTAWQMLVALRRAID